jgi:hypothetical protein
VDNETDVFKLLLVLFLGSFVPITAISFLVVRRSRKAVEFGRVVGLLGIAADDAEFARNRVVEQYAGGGYRVPVVFAFLVTAFGFYSLLFGAELVTKHEGRINFLLTAMAHLLPDEMQRLREDSMVVMTLAFVGAFIWSAQNILYRLNAGDLAPWVYFSAGLRMIFAAVLSLMVFHLLSGYSESRPLQSAMPAIAFLVGWFPERALLFLKQRASGIFRQGKAADALPLDMIEGIGTYDRARLYELGIANAQNLACANFIELVVRTAFSPGQIIDWIGQAQLYLYFGDSVVSLRKHQIRTVFDAIPLSRDPALQERVAAAAGIDATGLRLYSERQAAEPGVQQLLGFQRRLLAGTGVPDRAA